MQPSFATDHRSEVIIHHGPVVRRERVKIGHRLHWTAHGRAEQSEGLVG